MTITVKCFKMQGCAPCKMLEPIIKDVCKEHHISLEVIDVDDNRTLAIENGIKAAPTTIIYKDNVEIDRIVGALPRSKLVEKLVTPYV